MNPPRTIDELLSDIDRFSSKTGDKALDADAAIRSSYWANRFRTEFLERRKMYGKVASLRFLVATQVFEQGTV